MVLVTKLPLDDTQIFLIDSQFSLIIRKQWSRKLIRRNLSIPKLIILRNTFNIGPYMYSSTVIVILEMICWHIH